MKTYFEYQTQLPKGEEEGEDAIPFTKAKIDSTGEDWVKNKKEKQAQDDAVDNIFGADLYRQMQTAQRKGEIYESHAAMGLPEEVLDHDVALAKKKIPRLLADLEDALEGLSRREPLLVSRFFHSFLKQTPDIDRAVRGLGFDGSDFAYDETDEDFMESIGSTEEQDPMEYRKKRQAFIAREIAGICTAQYAERVKTHRHKKPIFTEIIAHHVREEQLKARDLLERVREYPERLKRLIKESPYRAFLPEEFVNERLDHLGLAVLDGLAASLQERYGDYDAATHTIRLSSDLSPNFAWRVYVHEALHALSGRTEVVRSFPDIPELDFYSDLQVGLRFTSGSSESDLVPPKARPQLGWLNEAVTESLTLSLAGSEDIGIYGEERALLDLLIRSADLPREVVVAAYFENFRGDRLPNHPAPALRELFQRMNARLGKRFLVDLDLFIQFYSEKSKKEGLHLVMQKWKTLGEAFPQFVHRSAENIRKGSK